MAMTQPKPVQEEIELPDPNEPKKDYGGGEAGGVAGSVAQAHGVEEAPQYMTTGFKPPRPAKKTCLAENMKMSGDVANLVTGPVTVKFAVYANGIVGAIQILSPVDPRVTNAIKRSISACEWAPGSDAQGRATALWVIQPFRFVD
jgi:protein TonB